MEKRLHSLEAMIHYWVLQEEKRQREARELRSASQFSRDASSDSKIQTKGERDILQ